VLNLNLTSLFADKFGLVAALLLGTVICVISVINSIAIAYLDRRAELVIDKRTFSLFFFFFFLRVCFDIDFSN